MRALAGGICMRQKMVCGTLAAISLICAASVVAADRPQRVISRQQPSVSEAQQPVAAPSILSIVPAQAEPGSKVTIYGAGFGEQVSVFLGSAEIAGMVTDNKQVEVTIPQLDPGLYALYVKRPDGVAGRVYNFNVLPLRPVLTALAPDRVTICGSAAEHEVTARGRNFNTNSQVLFDGAVIPARVVASDQIVFATPETTGGMHQVQIKNDTENGSLPRAMHIESKPEINQVSIGSEFVNYYELNIYGRNFQQNSAIYVDGQRVGNKGGQEAGDREKLLYVDCTQLVYQRHPYSSTNKDFRIQVINQAGEASQVINVTAP